jgi:Tol biopolymer transport system component
MERSVIGAIAIATLPLVVGIAWASGGAALQISGGVNAGEFSITPEGSRIVFLSYNGADTVFYSARVDGVGAPNLISPASGSSNLFNSKFTPDSSRFVFNTYESPADGLHVVTYSSRVDGSGAPVPLNNSKLYDDDPSQYNLAISPDSQRVVIRADQGDYNFDLLSRRVDGSGGVVPLNDPSSHGDGAFGNGVQYDWTPAGNNVVFKALAAGEEARQLFSRVFDGSLPAVQLSPGGRTFIDYVVSGDGTKVALTASGGGKALYSRGADGTALTMLTADDDNPNAFQGLWIDPHGQHVIYSTNLHLSTVPTDGSAAAKSLSPNPNPDGQDIAVAVSPDGQRVAILSRTGNSAPQELYVSPIDASQLPKKLNSPLPAGGNIDFMVFSPDSKHIVYFGDQLTDGVEELFSVPADASHGPVRLTSSSNFRITPDGRNVIYSTGTLGNISALYSIGIDGGEPVLLASNPYLTGGIQPWGEGWQITPDGSMLIFTANDGGSKSGIYAVAIPEPGCLAVLMSGGIMMSWRRSRRRR